MTLFAGIVDFNKPLENSACEILRSSLSRHESEDYQEYRRPNAYIVKIDVGALSPLPPIVDTMHATFMCGSPLLADGEDLDRLSQASRIHGALSSGSGGDAFSEVTGAFCGVHHDVDQARYTLFTDKLAIRPVYYAYRDGFLIFASALRILEQFGPPLRLTVDLIGLAGKLGYGFPLGTRTPYNEIKCLRAAEAVSFSRDARKSTTYWRWSEIKPMAIDLESSARLCLDAFHCALRRRIQGDRRVQAFLSGGLDSRLITTVLKLSGIDLHTFNFSRSNTADKTIAREFSRVVGSRHHECELPMARMIAREGDLFSAYLQPHVADGKCYGGDPPDRPRVVWSGDGGSVGLGHVYLDQTMVDAFSKRSRKDIIKNAILLRRFIPTRIFKAKFGFSIKKSLENAIVSELSDIEPFYIERRAYLFFIMNDQRRHLYSHFEEVDLHRIELETPFFDSKFISTVASVPISFCLMHKLYHEILRLLPGWCGEVAWQTYPGHLPCPLPLPTGSEYQWGKKSPGYTREKHAYWSKRGVLLSFQKLPIVLQRGVIILYFLRHIILRKDESRILKDATTIINVFDIVKKSNIKKHI